MICLFKKVRYFVKSLDKMGYSIYNYNIMRKCVLSQIMKKGDTSFKMLTEGEGRSLLIIFIVLVCLSAYFSCSESAFSLMNKIRVKNMADEGNKKAKKALYISNNFEKALTTILIGNNIVNIAAASVATLIVMNALSKSTNIDEGAQSAISTVITTAIIFLFGEMIPKSLANDRPLWVSLRFSGITKFIMKLFTPLSAFFGMITKRITRLFKGDEEPSITEEELYDIIDTAEEEGVVDEDQSDLFKSAIEFSETTAENVMTMRGDIVGIDISLTNDEIMLIIRNTNHSRLPVYEGGIDNIIGTLPIRNFIKEYYKDPSLDIRTILIPPFFVKANAKIDDLLTVMRQHKFYLAVVSDEEGETIGIVTIEDFLEELVGEIWDEDDVVDHNFTKLGGNKFRVNTKMIVSDAFARMHCDEPENHIAVRPILSWIIETFGKIPDEGDSFTYRNLEITVDTVENGRVSHVEIRIMSDSEIAVENSAFADDDLKIVGGEDIL
ncbi:MAG: HlyC/CorC family transporter [Ruminococcaceae bacterium]|nr:HlyC/CorC family transporter [Oscillospiraceae bacterium]